VRRLSLVCLAAALCLAAVSGRVEARPEVVVARLDGQAITPVTARFIERSMATAADQEAAAYVLVLDTPGGLVDETRAIVKAIVEADVPVIVYVPSGGRAASAGLFILIAAHVAAMAPGSNTGAAHPVTLGGLPAVPDIEKPPAGQDDGRDIQHAEKKAVEDTSAWARALANLRGRDSSWIEQAVRKSLSATAEEALEHGVIDLVARDLDELLARCDGREVELAAGPIRLTTDGARIQELEMWWGERILATVSHPNIALLLLLFGFYGVLFELYSPGWGVPGTVGVIALVLAFFALAILPISYVGLALILVALALFVAEAFVVSYGALALGGIASLVLGALMLVDSPAGFLRVSLDVVLPLAVATAALTVFLVSRVVRAHHGRVRVGAETMTGAEATCLAPFEKTDGQYLGTVRMRGENWRALASAPLAAGQVVRIRDRHGLTVTVDAVDEPPP